MNTQIHRPATLTVLAMTYVALSLFTSPALATVGPPPISCADHILYLDRDTGTGDLFLNATAPSSVTSKFIDSPSLSAVGGNPYKVIGEWDVAVGSGICTLNTTGSLSALHAWVGLKNSDDIGTKFDILAQVFVNGDTFPLRQAEARCVSHLTRNPADAKEVVIGFGTFSPSSTDINSISIKISARIGTVDTGTCPGHQNARGLRLYFDAMDRDSRFDVLLRTPE